MIEYIYFLSNTLLFHLKFIIHALSLTSLFDDLNALAGDIDKNHYHGSPKHLGD